MTPHEKTPPMAVGEASKTHLRDGKTQKHHSMFEAIAAAGYAPPDHIAPGKFYRYPGLDKKPSNRAGYCLLFDDLKAGIFGDFSTGFKQTWLDGESRDLTLQERLKLREQIRVAEGHRRADLEILRNDAAIESNVLWNSGSEEISHPYPEAKLIQPYGARQVNNMLLVPMRFNGALVNIQRIFPDGKKLFLKNGRVIGSYHLIGEPQERIRVAEGFATACSIHERKGYTVAVSFNCNNLKSVSLAIKEKYGSDIIICADNDANTRGNPGLSAAKEAAALVGGTYIYPMFDSGQEGTDFNDYINGGGVL